MARSLAAEATTEKDKQTGAFPRRILEIQYPGGTAYYSSEAFDPGSGGDTLGTTCAARVVSWGEISLEAEAGQVGGHGQVAMMLRDEDLALKAIFDTKPGVQNVPCYIHLWFSGTGWSKRETIFGGILTTPLVWDSSTAIWTVTAKGFEEYYDREFGKKLDRETFPEVQCGGDCEGSNIPIAYGNPVVRVPACVIDRPGNDQLAAYLGIHDTTLTINRNATAAGFTVGSPITLLVGWPHNIELITGQFPTDGTTFNITSRGAIQASGESPGVYTTGGERYLLLDRSDITNEDQSRVGWPLYYDADKTGDWVTLMVDEWFRVGGNQGVMREPYEATFKTGGRWKLAKWPSDVYWLTGTPVYEFGTWTYAANMLPSTSVARVEAKAEVEAHDPRGTKVTAYFTYDPSRYTVNLNNTAYNAALGISGGLTTITTDAPPQRYGVSDEKIYVTLVRKNTAGEIIEDILTHPDLGAVPSANVNSPMSDATPLAFAITEEKTLNDTVADLAQQAGALLFWDAGKATLKSLSNTLGASNLTATPANTEQNSLTIEASPVSDVPTEMAGQIQTAADGPEIELIRTSPAAAAEYGIRRRGINLWAIQDAGTAGGILEFWLQYYLNRNRIVTFRTYLNGVHLQPGDVVTLDFDSGDGTVIFGSQKARVLRLIHTAGDVENNTMETIEITCELNLWAWAINSIASPQDEDCEDPLPEPDFYDPDTPASKQTSPNRPGRPYTPNTPRRPFAPVGTSSSSAASESTQSTGSSGTSTGTSSGGTSAGPPPGTSSGPGSSSAPGTSSVGTSGTVGTSTAGTSSGPGSSSGPGPSSAGGDCISSIDGVELATLEQVGNPDYVLTLKDGCMTLTPVSYCPGDSSGGV